MKTDARPISPPDFNPTNPKKGNRMRLMTILTLLMSLSTVACSQDDKSDSTVAKELNSLTEAPTAPDFKFLPDEVAKVGDKVLTREYVVERINERAKVDPMFGYMVLPQLKTKEMVKERILMPLINSEIMLQLAAKAGFPADSTTCAKIFDEQVAKMPKELLEQMTAQLKTQGRTVEQAREEFIGSKTTQEQAAIQFWIEKVIIPTITITDTEIKAMYDATKDSSVNASHILIAPVIPAKADLPANEAMTQATAEQKAEAKAKLEAILVKIKAGEDFGKMAEDNSACPSGKKAKGSLGTFNRGQMVPIFEEVSFKLEPGSISEVFESPFGYHIVRRATFEECKADLTQAAQNEALENAIEKQIEAAKSDIKVDIKI